MDIAEDHRMKLWENEQLNKYMDLAKGLKKLWNMMATVIPILVSILEYLDKETCWTGNYPDHNTWGSIEYFVLEIWGDLQSLGFSNKFSFFRNKTAVRVRLIEDRTQTWFKRNSLENHLSTLRIFNIRNDWKLELISDLNQREKKPTKKKTNKKKKNNNNNNKNKRGGLRKTVMKMWRWG